MNKTWQGPTRAGAWRVDGTTGTVFPLWDGIELIPVVNLSKKFEQPLEVVVDMEAFTRKYPGWAVVVSGPAQLMGEIGTNEPFSDWRLRIVEAMEKLSTSLTSLRWRAAYCRFR